jgi:hypothetical protein
MQRDSQLLLKLTSETLREKFYDLRRVLDIAELLEPTFRTSKSSMI